MANRTLTNRGSRDVREAPLRLPCLVRLIDNEHPGRAGSRHELGTVEEVVIGRADATLTARSRRDLALAVADPHMSQRHARLAHTPSGWTIEDLKSRNGTFVNGTRVEQAQLTDGALIELGRHTFLFHVTDRGSHADVTADELEPALPGIVTFSTELQSLLAGAARLARSGHQLVLHGETGSGKEVIARGIHAASGRSGAFVALNCAAIPPNLMESELFGFKKGSFSGATEDRIGLIRSSHGGTLFLDEIADLAPATQTALLRVLQQREVMSIGMTKPIAVDLRVVTASHRDLEAEVAAGRFREDLLARLAGFVLEIPSLKARREDLGIIIATLLQRLAPGRSVRFAPEVGYALASYHWPRNVRELEQVLGAALALADDVIEPRHLAKLARVVPTAALPQDDLAPSEIRRRDQLRALLATHHGNVAAVARAMKVARMQVHRWVERYAFDLDSFRKRD